MIVTWIKIAVGGQQEWFSGAILIYCLSEYLIARIDCKLLAQGITLFCPEAITLNVSCVYGPFLGSWSLSIELVDLVYGGYTHSTLNWADEWGARGAFGHSKWISFVVCCGKSLVLQEWSTSRDQPILWALICGIRLLFGFDQTTLNNRALSLSVHLYRNILIGCNYTMRGRDGTETAMHGISKKNLGRAFASPWEGEQWRIKDRPIGSDTLNGGGGYSYVYPPCLNCG